MNLRKEIISLFALLTCIFPVFGQFGPGYPTCDVNEFFNYNFEAHSAPNGVGYMNYATFNSTMDSVSAFGNVGSGIYVVPHTSIPSSFGSMPGNDWLLVLRGGGESISLKPWYGFVAGQEYCLYWYDRKISGNAVPRVEVGLSNSPVSFGTLVASSTDTLMNDWGPAYASFIAPVSASYMTIRTSGVATDLSALDFFGFIAVLPATNVSLEGKRIALQKVQIEWEFDDFEGEVWLEKEGEAGVFKVLGNGTEEALNRSWKRFVFLDENAGEGAIRYRLAFRSRDGQVKHSETLLIDAANLSNQLHLFPNPVEDELNLTAHGSFLEGPWNMQVFDVQGNKILENAGEGFDQTRIQAGDWEAGIYLLRFSHNGLTETRKFIVK